VLIGRLTRDPELRYTQSGKAFATFTLAVDRRFRRQAEQNGQPTADFIPCMAWDKLAEIIGNNLAKGRRVGVEGRLQTRTYEAQDGSKRSAFDVVLDELEFLDPKGAAPQGGGYGQGFGAPAPQAQQAPAGNDFGPNISDEEIPF
jgi:single-strand DNA-binding protein